MNKLFSTFLILLFSISLNAQNLTGIWRGSFYSIQDLLMGGSKSRYEVQIDDSKKPVDGRKGIDGVAYSYQNTRFYGKADSKGIWNPEQKMLIFEETKLLEFKYSDGGGIYLFTCYLDYKKVGDKEILEGTYTSKHYKTGEEGGGGKIYLEKVPDTDFEEEDFLKKKDEKTTKGKIKPGTEEFVVKKTDTSAVKKNTPHKITTQKKVTPKPEPKKAPVTVKKTTPPIEKAATPPVVKKPTPVVKKPAPAVAKKEPAIKPDVPNVVGSTKKYADSVAVREESTAKVVQPPTTRPVAPAVLKQRVNELFQTINTPAKDIVISFYDNGEIDGDTISIYDNNRLLAKNKGLSTQPITIKVTMDENDPEHDIVMVAENLGSIPPNTALMIVQAGEERFNIRLSSNEQKNAMVKIRYKPDLGR
jgi:hypothetical protein